jgi:hypothetical protein
MVEAQPHDAPDAQPLHAVRVGDGEYLEPMRIG